MAMRVYCGAHILSCNAGQVCHARVNLHVNGGASRRRSDCTWTLLARPIFRAATGTAHPTRFTLHALRAICLSQGASSGLGFETARVLGNAGATIIAAVLPALASSTLRDLTAAIPNGAIEIVEVDLGNLDSVRTAAAAYVASAKRIDILINNAGVMSCPLTPSADGYELQFAVNYLVSALLS